jgi:alpha-galactosidase
MLNDKRLLDLSIGELVYQLDLTNGIALDTFGLTGRTSWVRHADAARSDFAVYVDGRRIDGSTEGLVCENVEERTDDAGVRHTTVTLRYQPAELVIERHLIRHDRTTLVESWVDVRNAGSRSITVERVDSFILCLPQEAWNVMYYSSDWGSEFEPVVVPLGDDGVTLQTRHGRSSKGMHPWMTLFRSDGQLLTVSPMWSGNWILRCEPDENGNGYTVSGGLSDWEFSKTLAPGESMEGIRVAMALGSGGDLNSTSIPFARVGRKIWYPRNELSRSLPAEWNHWWSYEDKTINEQVFRDNAEEAARLGMDVCTLDAGWFGPSDPGTDWYDYRGDWEKVNTVRFPSGIRALSDHVHGLGMKFGLWCEIEAVGKHADLSLQHPRFVARRDGESLGYLCFGNPEVQDWAYRTLDRLIADYSSDWIKLDFNLDPQAGCNCVDHGHGAGDGLYEHYNGYYRVLERIRSKHPEVILENCSSGGLRIDLGMMKQTHTTFLSDPDWPEHSLQVFWGATTMLAPDACLHWSYSEWIMDDHPTQRFRPGNPDLKPHQFDYYTRIAMLRGFGVSQKLPELPAWIHERLAHHVRVYQETVRPFIREADLYRLTGQPKRWGQGDRWAAFQYSMTDEEDHLLFVFRLDQSEATRAIRMQKLLPEASYLVNWLSEDKREIRSGRELLEDGLCFSELKEEESALLRFQKI